MNEQTESERPPLASRLRMLAMACAPGMTVTIRQIDPQLALDLADLLDDLAKAADRQVRNRRTYWIWFGITIGLMAAPALNALVRWGLH